MARHHSWELQGNRLVVSSPKSEAPSRLANKVRLIDGVLNLLPTKPAIVSSSADPSFPRFKEFLVRDIQPDWTLVLPPHSHPSDDSKLECKGPK